jgi:hypothetical protein
VGPLDAEGVVSLLWRDRMVPKWIDMWVWAADEHTTYFQLTCCGPKAGAPSGGPEGQQ